MIRTLAMILLMASPVFAQSVPKKIANYVKTHRELLASDALIVLAYSADAASGVHCESVRPHPCYEENPLLGNHPSAAKQWGYLGGLALASVAGDHILWHVAKDTKYKHLIWATTIALTTLEGRATNQNVNAAEAAERDQARKRLAQ